ncbi:unnamed protein product [Symbiodinium natans]|uniref:Uncharacterized protein n=1 Tax=Symbiodinium natans TaxID=878477 RepID=A0A812KJH5_9DINO|nr:unnamed protein product [Symbiodinium natans]
MQVDGETQNVQITREIVRDDSRAASALYQQFGSQPGVEARMQLQEKAGGQPSPSPPFGASGSFGSYYAAHVATALVPAQLSRLYQQFGAQPGPEARTQLQAKADGQPSRSPPFGASGSFGGYYAAHIATALVPAQLPRLYQQFGAQPGPEARTQLQAKADGQPSRSPPFGASGSFGSYYAAHVATALVPAQLPRLYQQFGAQPGPEARTQLQAKAGSGVQLEQLSWGLCLADGQPSRSPPFGASGSFGSYYAAHVATALVPAQLPRLYQQFGAQPGPEARTQLQAKAGSGVQLEQLSWGLCIADGQPSRSPPFGASGSFGSYYAAHVATALVPAQLPRLYQQFGAQPDVEARTQLQEKAPWRDRLCLAWRGLCCSAGRRCECI